MTKVNIAEDANAFVRGGASEVLNTYGKSVLPAQMNGEGLENTPYMNAVGMARQNVEMPSGRTWSEPGIPFSGSTRGAVWQSTYGGSYVEIGGNPNSEFINIIHRSGARITIANDGSVTISAAGDIVLTSDENSVEVFDGAKEGVYKAGYTIGVSGGKTVINSTAGIDLISGQDINILAGGAINLNAGNGIDLSSSRIAISAKVDTLDLYAAGKLSIESVIGANVKSGKALNLKGKGINLSGKGGNIALSGDKIHLNSSGNDAEEATSANISSLKAPPAYVVDTAMPVTFSVGGISATDVDDPFTE
jgi:hypothetical protein